MWEMTYPQIHRMVYRHYRRNLYWWWVWLTSRRYRRNVQAVAVLCGWYREPFHIALKKFREDNPDLTDTWPDHPRGVD